MNSCWLAWLTINDPNSVLMNLCARTKECDAQTARLAIENSCKSKGASFFLSLIIWCLLNFRLSLWSATAVTFWNAQCVRQSCAGLGKWIDGAREDAAIPVAAAAACQINGATQSAEIAIRILTMCLNLTKTKKFHFQTKSRRVQSGQELQWAKGNFTKNFIIRILIIFFVRKLSITYESFTCSSRTVLCSCKNC